MVRFHPTAACVAHLPHQIGTVKKKSDGVRKLLAIPVGVKKSGDAMLDELPTRPQVGCNDRLSPRIGLENRFPERLIGVRWKGSEAGPRNEALKFLAMHTAPQISTWLKFNSFVSDSSSGRSGPSPAITRGTCGSRTMARSRFVDAFFAARVVRSRAGILRRQRADHVQAKPGNGAEPPCVLPEIRWRSVFCARIRSAPKTWSTHRS